VNPSSNTALYLCPRATVLAFCVALFVVGGDGLVAPKAAMAELYVNEFLASNGIESGDADFDGHFEDWLEIYNSGPVPVTLQSYTLTDDPAIPGRWTFPSVIIPVEGFLRVWTSGKNRTDPAAELHTNFQLERNGESITLADPSGLTLDSLQYDVQRRNTSYGRQPDGSSDFVFFLEPTPGASNTTTGYPQMPSVKPTFSPDGGFFSQLTLVVLGSTPAAADVHYTLDGSEPDQSSPIYSVPIPVSENTVVRAVAFLNGVQLSEVDGRSYFFTSPRHIPIVSISLDEDHLWDPDTGIFANPEQTGLAWERTGNFEMYAADGTRAFSTGAGLRVHGGASRLNSEKHSLRVYFRGPLGDPRLEYPLFAASDGIGGITANDRFDTLVLRAGYHDSWSHFNSVQRQNSIYVRDQFVRDLHLRMGQLNARGLWTALYINGEYYGLFNLTERIDEEFLDAYSTFDQWDVIKEGVPRQGDEIAWSEFVDFMMRSNLADPAAYLEAIDRFDLENLRTYVVVNTWAGNRDWPRRNWYAARNREEPDAKWRFYSWDAEQTFNDNRTSLDAGIDTLSAARAQNGPLAEILDSLLRNKSFRLSLLDEFDTHLAGLLHPDTAIPHLDTLVDEIHLEIQLESARWEGESFLTWASAVERTREFIRRRAIELPPILSNVLGADEPEFPQLTGLPVDLRVAFIVRDATNPSAANTLVAERLAARGARVDMIRETDDVPSVIVSEFDLLIIASNIQAANVAADYTDLPIPRIISEPGLLVPTWEPLSGSNITVEDQYRVRIVDDEHPITHGIPVDELTSITTSRVDLGFGQGVVGEGVVLLATGENPNHYAVMAADVGAQYALPAQTAPARTVFLALGDEGFHRANGHLARLFDQAVDWAINHTPTGAHRPFIRGDVNEDDKSDVSDVVATLGFLFRGQSVTDCRKTMDANDDGQTDIADAISLLVYLFRGGPAPPAPFPEKGTDPTPDGLPCPILEP